MGVARTSTMPQMPEPFTTRSFRFACAVVRFYCQQAKRPDLPLHLLRQVLRSGTSVGANLEEAKGAQSRKDTAAKFSIALKEAREVSYWLRLLEATELVKTAIIKPLREEANELIAILTVARRKLSQNLTGTK